jgi:hypothetical protein
MQNGTSGEAEGNENPKGKKMRNLILQAINILAKADDPTSLWRAYVAVEYAILDIKLRHGLEHVKPPPVPKRSTKRDELFSAAKAKLGELDIEKDDPGKLLYRLRECRDALKALLASSTN